MRDIRPKNSKRPYSDDLADEVQEVFESTQQSRKQAAVGRQKPSAAKSGQATSKPARGLRRLGGATVPVAAVATSAKSVHSSRSHAPASPPRSRQREQTAAVPHRQPRASATPNGGQRPPRVGHRERLLLLIFIGITGAVALIAGLIFLPTAAITLTLKTAPLLVDETIMVRADGGDGEAGVRGTAFFRELVIEDTVPVETTEIIGETAAGTVAVVNATDQEQPIREQSRLTDAEGHVYYMQRHAIVPPGGRVSVAVTAAEAGDPFNAPAGERLDFVALDASSQSVVFAEVAGGGITGGSGETITVVGQADIDRAHLQAAERAREQARNEIAGELQQGWTLLPESWTTEVTEFVPNNQTGDRVATLPYRARMSVRVLGYEQAALEAALESAVEQQLAENFMLFPGPISYEAAVQNVQWDETRAELNVRVTHSTIPALSIPTLREKLAGRSAEEAAQYLEGLPGVERAEVATWPFWVRSVPRIEKRIELHFESDREP